MAEEIIEQKLNGFVRDAFKSAGKNFKKDDLSREECKAFFEKFIQEEDWD